MRLFSAFALSASLLASAAAAHADTFNYEFDTAFSIGTAAFTYTSPQLITADAFVTPATCQSTLNGVQYTCSSVELVPLGTDGQINFFLQDATSSGELSFINLPSGFFAVGTHPFAFGTFTVTDVSGASPVPEPSTFAFLGTGLLGATGAIRRRFLA